MVIKFNIVTCDGDSAVNKAYTEITLSHEHENISDEELRSVIPHILSTYRLPNGDMMTMIIKEATVFKPFPYPTLMITIRERRPDNKTYTYQEFMNVVCLILKDICLRYGDKSTGNILVHGYGKTPKGLSGYSKLVDCEV